MSFEQALNKAGLVEIDARVIDGVTLVKVIDKRRQAKGFSGVCTLMRAHVSAIPCARELENKNVPR